MPLVLSGGEAHFLPGIRCISSVLIGLVSTEVHLTPGLLEMCANTTEVCDSGPFLWQFFSCPCLSACSLSDMQASTSPWSRAKAVENPGAEPQAHLPRPPLASALPAHSGCGAESHVRLLLEEGRFSWGIPEGANCCLDVPGFSPSHRHYCPLGFLLWTWK